MGTPTGTDVGQDYHHDRGRYYLDYHHDGGRYYLDYHHDGDRYYLDYYHHDRGRYYLDYHHDRGRYYLDSRDFKQNLVKMLINRLQCLFCAIVAFFYGHN